MKAQDKAVVIFALCASVSVQSPTLSAQTIKQQGSEWVELAANSDGTVIYSAKRGSFEVGKTKAGTSIVVGIGQTQNKNDKSVSYSKWYVSTNDCENGIGKFVSLKISGDYDYEVDYVTDGVSVASILADHICSAYLEDAKASSEKGL